MDGKPIYRKCFSVSITVKGQDQYISIGIDNAVDTPILCNTSIPIIGTVPYVPSDFAFTRTIGLAPSGKLIAFLGSGITLPINAKGYVEYTKK